MQAHLAAAPAPALPEERDSVLPASTSLRFLSFVPLCYQRAHAVVKAVKIPTIEKYLLKT